MASEPQFDSSQPFEEVPSTTPVFDPSKPFQETTDTAEPEFDPSQPFQEVAPSKEERIKSLTEEYKTQQNEPLLTSAGKFLKSVPQGVVEGVTSLPSVVSNVAQFLNPISAQSGVQNPGAALNIGKSNLENEAGGIWSGLKRQGANLLGRLDPMAKLSDQQLQDLAAQSVERQNAEQAANEAAVKSGMSPESVQGARFVEDPVNLALIAAPEIAPERLAGEAALKGAAEATLPAKAAAGLAKGVGKTAEAVSGGIEAAKGMIPEGLVKTAELGEKSGATEGAKSMLEGLGIGGLMGGPHGMALGAGISYAPAFIKNVGEVANSASRLLNEGKTYTRFFEGIAKDPTISSGAVKVMANFMDKSGLGTLVENGVSAGWEGAKMGAVFAPLNIVMADTPEQAGEMSGNAMSIAGLSHFGIDTLAPGNRRLVALKQANEVAKYMQNLRMTSPDAVEMWQKKFEQDPKNAASELSTVALLKNYSPRLSDIKYEWNENAGATSGFDPSTGAITLNLAADSHNNIGRIMGHEVVHEWEAAGLRPHLTETLIGNPELKSSGVLGNWDETGKFIPNSLFQKFIENYNKGLSDSPEKLQAYNSGSSHDVASRYAEEWLAESMGSYLTGRTGSGELTFAKLKRNNAVDNILDKMSGLAPKGVSNVIQKMMYGSGISPRFGAGEVVKNPAIMQPIRDIFKNYIKTQEMTSAREKGFKYLQDFSDRAISDDAILKNPAQAEKIAGSSNEFRFSLDKNGNKIVQRVKTARAAEKFAQAQGAAVVAILKNMKPESVTDIQRREIPLSSGGTRVDYSGSTMSDNLFNALMTSSVFNDAQKKNFQVLRETLKQPGGWVRMFYQPVIAEKGKGRSKKAQARVAGYYNTIPLDFLISEPKGEGKGSNILTTLVDLNQLESNFVDAVNRAEKGGPVIPENANTFQKVLNLFKIMSENHKRGYGAVGDVLSGYKQVGEAFGTMSKAEKDFVNELFGVGGKDSNNPIRAMLDEHGLPSSKSVVKTFRIDRINDLTPLGEETPIPAQYYRMKHNLSPEEKKLYSGTEDRDKINGWMDTSGNITSKGTKFHDEKAAEMLGMEDRTAAADALFDKGHMRTRVDLGRLYLSNEKGTMPTAKQIREAKDLAIEHGLKNVTFDGPQGPKVLWSASQEGMSYSPHEETVQKIKDPKFDGMSFDVTGKELQHAPNTVLVSVQSTNVDKNKLTPELLQKVASSTPENIKQYGEISYGAFPLDSEGKKVSIDTNISFPASMQAEAVELGKKLDQQAIGSFDENGNFVSIPTGGKGGENHDWNDVTRLLDSTLRRGDFGKPLSSPVEEKPTAEPFYSKVEKTVDTLPERFTVGQLKAALSPEKGIKPEELQWMNFESLLNGKNPEDKVRKSEVQKWTQESKVQVKEVVKGDESGPEAYNNFVKSLVNKYGEDKFNISSIVELGKLNSQEASKLKELRQGLSNSTKYENYQLPGGNNYRELLFTLPFKDRYDISELQYNEEESNKRGMWIIDAPGQRFQIPINKSNPDAKSAMEYIASSKSRSDTSPTFKSSHFDEPNILAHVRFNERTDSEGKKVLFIEEVQSDWHQQGRKEGYEKSNDRKEFEALRKIKWGDMTPEQQDRYHELDELASEGGMTNHVPDAPFKKTWHELAMKRMLDWAVKNGFDKVAWTTGEQQAERYDLSKQIDSIQYSDKNHLIAHKNGEQVLSESVNPDKLSDIIGKDVANKLLDAPLKDVPRSSDKVRRLEGQDLKVGGEGMKGFYDRMLPDFMNKYGKKFGAKVEPINLSGAVKETVHGVDITPLMSETIKTQGQSLFSPAEKFTTDKDTQLVPKTPLEHGMSGKRMRLIHYSSKPDLSTIDPKHAGKGIDKGKNDPGIKKSFFFVSGSNLGQDKDLVGKNIHSVVVSPKGIYDLSGNDPLKFWDSPNREVQEEMLKKAGYSGIHVRTQGRDVVALFYPVKVKR